jgi:hypothetical protein
LERRLCAALIRAKVDNCLKSGGYTHFRLTDSPRKHLGRVHLGSARRHIYLYQLGTDPAALKTQAM